MPHLLWPQSLWEPFPNLPNSGKKLQKMLNFICSVHFLMFSWAKWALGEVKDGLSSREHVASSMGGGGSCWHLVSHSATCRAGWDPSRRSSQSAWDWIIKKTHIVSSADFVSSWIYPFHGTGWTWWQALCGHFLTASGGNHGGNNSLSFFCRYFSGASFIPCVVATERH